MQAGGVASHEVYSIGGRVLVNGQDVGADVLSVSVQRDIPEPLPGASAAFQASTATVTADRSGAVSSTTQHPWNALDNWPPKPSDLVEVWLSDGVNEWRQIRGNVTGLSGSTESNVVTFEVVDRYQALNRSVSLPSLSDMMPPSADGAPYIRIGLRSTFLTDAVLRQAGRFCTPSRSNGCIVSVPFQGSAWPEVGTCIASGRLVSDAEGEDFPTWLTSVYGLRVKNIEAKYTPSMGGSGTVFDRPMEITQEVVDVVEADTAVSARFASGYVALIQGLSSIQARYYPSSGSSVTLASVSKAGVTRATARLTNSGGTLSAEIRTRRDDGTVSAGVSGSTTVLAGDLSGSVAEVRARGVGSQGAFQVAYPATAWSRVGEVPSAVIHAVTGLRNNLLVSPELINVNATDLLTEQASAEMCSWWIDENDVLQWWDHSLLVGANSAGTLTAADHIVSIPWEYDYDSVRRQVHVDYQTVSITQRSNAAVTLWTGSGESYANSGVDEQFVTTPDDEMWFGVDYATPNKYTSQSTDRTRINHGVGSVVGGIATTSSGGERVTASISTLIRKVTDGTYAFNTSVSGLSTGEAAVTQFPELQATDTGLWGKLRNKPLPILRGRKRVRLQDARVTAAVQGDDSSPDIEHSVDWRIQGNTFAGRVADYIASFVTSGQALIPSLEIMPVFNLQVGDVIVVDDPEVMGVQVRALVIGNNISADFSEGKATQSVSLRPLSVTRTGGTWAEFGERNDSLAWSQWAASRAGDSWSDFGSKPLS